MLSDAGRCCDDLAPLMDIMDALRESKTQTATKALL